MNDSEEKPSGVNQQLAWKLYESVGGILQQDHLRWVNNYKVFLSFNSFLLPAVTALLVYVLNEEQKCVGLFVALLCAVGAIAAWQGMGLLSRIHAGTNLRYAQLRQLEGLINGLPLKPFTAGYEHFFLRVEATGEKRGIRAVKAYKTISVTILVAYIILFVGSIWPFMAMVISRCH